jgi:hypothetical protein
MPEKLHGDFKLTILFPNHMELWKSHRDLEAAKAENYHLFQGSQSLFFFFNQGLTVISLSALVSQVADSTGVHYSPSLEGSFLIGGFPQLCFYVLSPRAAGGVPPHHL